MLERHSDPIDRICFSPDGTMLASGANGAVLVWIVESGALRYVYDRARRAAAAGEEKQQQDGARDFSEISGLSWDEESHRLAIGEGSHKVCLTSRHCLDPLY